MTGTCERCGRETLAPHVCAGCAAREAAIPLVSPRAPLPVAAPTPLSEADLDAMIEPAELVLLPATAGLLTAAGFIASALLQARALGPAVVALGMAATVMTSRSRLARLRLRVEGRTLTFERRELGIPVRRRIDAAQLRGVELLRLPVLGPSSGQPVLALQFAPYNWKLPLTSRRSGSPRDAAAYERDALALLALWRKRLEEAKRQPIPPPPRVLPPRFTRARTPERLEVRWGWRRQHALIADRDGIRAPLTLDADDLLAIEVWTSFARPRLMALMRKRADRVVLADFPDARLAEQLADDLREVLRLH